MSKKLIAGQLPAEYQTKYANMARKVKLTEIEYVTLINDIRRANRKATRLKQEGNALYIPRFSTKVDRISTRQDYLEVRKALTLVLSRNYKADKNREMRENLYNTLINIYGDSEDVNDIITKFESLTDRQMVDFFDTNNDLRFILFYPDEGMLDFIEETTDTLLARFENG